MFAKRKVMIKYARQHFLTYHEPSFNFFPHIMNLPLISSHMIICVKT